MSAVLVTGATTPLGNELIRRLLEEETHVLAVGAEQGGLRDAGGRLRYVQVDLTRPRRIRSLLHGPARDLGVDTVVHTALHRRATEEGPKVRRLNVEGTRALLALCEDHPTIKRFVFNSSGSVYEIGPGLPVLTGELRPVDLSADVPQWVRDRVEADVTVCTRMGLSPLKILVLRCAEILEPNLGSQLWDYLRSRVCLRPFGFDPMMNLLTISDAVEALAIARHTDANGALNIPGADTLPLSRVIALAGRRDVPLPGPLLSPLYRYRATTRAHEFRYDLNRRRFHFSSVLDGRRAKSALGYTPRTKIDWSAVATQVAG